MLVSSWVPEDEEPKRLTQAPRAPRGCGGGPARRSRSSTRPSLPLGPVGLRLLSPPEGVRTTFEHRTRENPYDLVYREGQVPFPAVWTVRLWLRSSDRLRCQQDYAVRAYERHTGARTDLRAYKTLFQARQSARRLFAIVTSAIVEEPWASDPVLPSDLENPGLQDIGS